MTAASGAPDAAVFMRRRITAPREVVFKAWTEPSAVRSWFRPGGDEVVLLGIEMDVRVGGGYRYTMGLESGESWSIVGIYREVRPPEKLIYTWSYEEEEMSVGETLITVEFRDLGAATEVVLSHERFPDGHGRDAHLAGWDRCLDGLAANLNRRS